MKKYLPPAISVIVGHSKDPNLDSDSVDGDVSKMGEELIDAIADKDADAVATIIESMFKVFDAEPPKEGKHEDEDSEDDSEGN